MRVATVLCLCSLVAPVYAQGEGEAASSSEIALADRLRREAFAAVDAGDLEEAAALLRRAYEVGHQERDILNLASISGEMGRIVDAVRLYRQYLRSPSAELEERVRAALAALEPRLSYLRLRVENLAAIDSILVDGEETEHATIGEDLPLDAGEHELRIVRGSEALATRTFALEEGRTESITLSLPRYVPPTPDAIGPSVEPSSSIAESWEFWLITTLIVGAVAAGLSVGLYFGLNQGGPLGNVEPQYFD